MTVLHLSHVYLWREGRSLENNFSRNLQPLKGLPGVTNKKVKDFPRWSSWDTVRAEAGGYPGEWEAMGTGRLTALPDVLAAGLCRGGIPQLPYHQISPSRDWLNKCCFLCLSFPGKACELYFLWPNMQKMYITSLQAEGMPQKL